MKNWFLIIFKSENEDRKHPIHMLAKKQYKYILFKNVKKFLKQVIVDDFVDSMLPEDVDLSDNEKLFKFLVKKSIEVFNDSYSCF